MGGSRSNGGCGSGSSRRAPPLPLPLLLLAAALLAACCSAAEADASCEELGFTGLQLCSDCEAMAEFVKDEELVADCKSCCVKDDGGGKRKFTHAKLEVCPYRLNGLPDIQDFIAKHTKRYKGRLTVSHAVGSYPKLVLTHQEHKDWRSSIRIDNWKVATIHEFLQDKLEKPGGGKVPGAS